MEWRNMGEREAQQDTKKKITVKQKLDHFDDILNIPFYLCNYLVALRTLQLHNTKCHDKHIPSILCREWLTFVVRGAGTGVGVVWGAGTGVGVVRGAGTGVGVVRGAGTGVGVVRGAGTGVGVVVTRGLPITSNSRRLFGVQNAQSTLV